METKRSLLSCKLWWLGLGVVLCAVGAKLALINQYGTDQPYADQWAAEGMFFLRGPLYYQINLEQIIATHGEHRPGLTRLWVRALVSANQGQWDCFVELVANLVIYGFFLVVLWQWMVRLTDRWGLIVGAFALVLFFALPGAYENFLWGFQSCFLFMLLTGLVHVTWTMNSDHPGWRWWIAQLIGLFGLFSIAAGAMSAAALLVVAVFELLRGKRNTWAWATLIANAILFGLGLLLLPEGAPHVDGKLVRLWDAIARSRFLLAWPFPAAWWGLLLQAPLFFLAVSAWRKNSGGSEADADKRLIAVGAWMLCTSFAIAYGRDVTPDSIGVRYFDGLILGLFANFLVLIRVIAREIRGRRWLWIMGGVVWTAFAGLGLWNYNNPKELGPLFKYQHDLATEQRQIVRDFLVSDDPAPLQEFATRTHRFPHMEYTLVFLRDPNVAPLLPPSLTRDGQGGRLSRWSVQIAAAWPVVVGAGAILLLAGMIGLNATRSKVVDGG